MAYKLTPNKMYMMPTHFGPGLGPRQGPGGRKFDCIDTPKTTSLSVSFLSNREQLDALIPDDMGLEIGEEPIVNIYASYMTDIEWLAGRGYNVLGVDFPVVFSGKQDRAVGRFLSVLWENLTDPILTGREQLGFSKIYCKLPEPTILGGETHCTASWLGFKFMDMHLQNMKIVEFNNPSENLPDQNKKKQNVEVLTGILHYKYVPRTGEWGVADANYIVLTPEDTPNIKIQETWKGEGTVQFHKARWEDLPTQYSIVNALHELEIKEYRGAVITKSIGGKDFSDQRILW